MEFICSRYIIRILCLDVHKWTSVLEKAWRTAGDHVVLMASPMIRSALPVKLSKSTSNAHRRPLSIIFTASLNPSTRSLVHDTPFCCSHSKNPQGLKDSRPLQTPTHSFLSVLVVGSLLYLAHFTCHVQKYGH